MNRKIFALTFTSLAVAVGLLMANQWLSNQIEELSHTSTELQKVYKKPQPVVTNEIKPVVKKREIIEIVPTFDIDPVSDPLAPAEKEKPKSEQKQVTKKKPKPRYDTPPRDLILPQ